MITIATKLFFFILGIISTLIVIILIGVYMAIKEVNNKKKFFKEYQDYLDEIRNPLKGNKR